MAKYATLKAAVEAAIKTNGQQQITGQVLQTQLVNMITSLGKFFQSYGGVVTSASTFTAGDENVLFFATEAGTYTDFGGAVLDGKTLHILYYDGSWHDTDTTLASGSELSALLAQYAKIDGTYPALTSGAALNLVGRGSVPASYLFRPTGGPNDIGTGTAQIKEFKGNSRVWNQLAVPHTAGSETINDLSVTYNADGSVTINGTASADTNVNITNYFFLPRFGHKIFISAGSAISGNLRFGIVGYGSSAHSAPSVDTYDGDTSWGTYINVYIPSGEQVNNKTFYPKVVDLTRLFNGAVPEGYTAADFEADYPLDYYKGNAGEILPFLGQQIETTGFNLYDPATGKAHLLGGQSNGYQITGTYTSLAFTGASGATSTITPDASGFFNVTEDGDLSVTGGNATDTCVHLVWSGTRNGEYDPYEVHTLDLPISTMTGKVNGEGESEVIFGSDGMNKAGTVYDSLLVDADGYARRAVKRLGKVDMGDLSWGASGVVTNGYYAPVNDAKYIDWLKNCLCSKYALDDEKDQVQNLEDKHFLFHIDGGVQYVYIRDSAFAGYTASQVAAALSGVMLVYELATPIEYVLDTPIYLGYYANDWGTEAIKPDNTDEPYTAPCNYDVQYAMNAVDAIRNLPRNYVSINSNGSDDSSLKALAGAISTALGVAITWTWDEATREYTFAVADNRAFKLVSVPASASAIGTAGNIAIDSNYLYICVATDTWKRVALATWE